jgi:hypothetical protein
MYRVAQLIAVFVTALWLGNGAAWAWGALGHAVIGDIAQRYLRPEVARQLSVLLEHDLNADGEPSGRTALAQAGSWADEIRGRPAGLGKEMWHFIDLEVCRTTDPQQVCPDGQCAPAQLKRLVGVLQDRHLDPHARNEALKWVVHLTGDIHQPLHAADRDDHGGNRVAVSFFGSARVGEITNLHRVWDVDLVERVVQQRGGQAAFAAMPISAADRARWEMGTIDDWVEESHAIAATFVYRRLPSGSVCGQPADDVIEIGASYYNAAAPIIARQLAKAGIRLAKLLNAALGGAP